MTKQKPKSPAQKPKPPEHYELTLIFDEVRNGKNFLVAAFHCVHSRTENGEPFEDGAQKHARAFALPTDGSPGSTLTAKIKAIKTMLQGVSSRHIIVIRTRDRQLCAADPAAIVKKDNLLGDRNIGFAHPNNVDHLDAAIAAINVRIEKLKAEGCQPEDLRALLQP